MPCRRSCESDRFHFYADEGYQPPHIHVRSPDGERKFWLDPIALASVQGIRPHDGGAALRWEETDEDLTVRGVVAGRFELPLD